MLHELLLALHGYPGSIFREDSDYDIKVVPDLPFMHASEEVQLNRLCKLATQYKKFQDFVKQYQGSPCNFTKQQSNQQQHGDTGQLKDGLYLRALCAGLDEVLKPYRKTLLTLEQQILADPNLTIGHVQQVLEPYQLLFPELANVLEQIIHLRAHGCYILELLHQFCICGQPMVKEALQKILYVCHCVMYRQVSTWLLHGILLDRHNEFFIHETIGPVSVERQDDDGDDDLGIGGVTGRQMKEVMQLTDDGKLAEKEHHSHHAIRAAMLPNYIPLRIAEKILFVGESVQMFENKKHNTSKYIVHADSVLGENEAKFAGRLHQLQMEPIFSVQRFEDAVDEIRICVSEHLWRLVVEEADLIGQLGILKDYFLLGRGELFLAFIDQSQTLLNTPPMKHTEHDVNVGFQQAAHRVLIEDDATLSQFNLIIKSKLTTTRGSTSTKKSEAKAQGKGSSETGWSCLGMTYNVHWPLHILFKQSVLDKYNMLFQFLLYVKRVQLELQQCWAMQMQCKHEKVSPSDGQKWLLRSHMAFLIDNLQYYLQVDVLETQFSQLVEKVKSTRDFETVRFAHDQFITSLMAQCFLLMKPVNHCLTEILEVCHSFCMLLTQNSKLTDRDYAHMDKLAQAFNRQSSLLFKILSGVQSHQASRHLTQLLLRLDFNKFYSKAEGVLARPSPGSKR